MFKSVPGTTIFEKGS